VDQPASALTVPWDQHFFLYKIYIGQDYIVPHAIVLAVCLIFECRFSTSASRSGCPSGSIAAWQGNEQQMCPERRFAAPFSYLANMEMDMPETSEASMDARARRAAKRVGYRAVKSRWRAGSIDNFGEFQIVDPFCNAIVAGARFDYSADDVIAFCSEA
jgi:hypothetical protein